MYINVTYACMLHNSTVTSYDPESEFNKGALGRLEAAGIPVLTSLEKLVKERLHDMIITSDCNILEECACGIISNMTRTRPATWRSLYVVLRELDSEGLTQEIEEYLCCESISYDYHTTICLFLLLN